MFRITQELPRASSDFGYGDITLYVGTFQFLHLSVEVPRRGRYNPEQSPIWADPLSLATTDGIDSLSFPPVTEMFHFTGYCVLFPNFLTQFPIAWKTDRLQKQTMMYYHH